MNEERREIALWLAAAALLLAVGLAAIVTAPDLAPMERVVYSDGGAEEPEPTPSETARIDLNTADQAALMQINGLGEKTAQRILAYRDSHGGFASVDELLQVEGVGEKKLEAWRPFLTVGEPKAP